MKYDKNKIPDDVLSLKVETFGPVSSLTMFTDDDSSLISTILSLDDDELTILILYHIIININRNSNIITIKLYYTCIYYIYYAYIYKS